MEYDKRPGTFKKVPRGFFYNFDAKDNIIPLGPKSSIDTYISKKSCFHGDENFWLNLPCFIECGKPQGTTHKGAQCKLANFVQVIISFV